MSSLFFESTHLTIKREKTEEKKIGKMKKKQDRCLRICIHNRAFIAEFVVSWHILRISECPIYGRIRKLIQISDDEKTRPDKSIEFNYLWICKHLVFRFRRVLPKTKSFFLSFFSKLSEPFSLHTSEQYKTQSK